MAKELQSVRLRHVRQIHAERDIPTAHVVAATAIQRAHKLMSDAQTEVLTSLRLTRPRYEVLNVLYFSPTGTMGPAELSRVILLHPASMTYTADTLGQQGLVTRVPDEKDGRVLALRITEEGRRLVAKAIRALGDVCFGLGDLTETEADQVSYLLSKLQHPPEENRPRSRRGVARQNSTGAAPVKAKTGSRKARSSRT